MAEIILEGVTKRFADGTVAVRDATFTVRDGELFILVGPSGCGKSTLLNMIVGLEEMSGGDLRVDGRSMRGVDPKDRDMAMVFQSYAIYPHMSVRENIAFPLKLAKVSAEETALRVSQVAEMLGLSLLLDRKPETLSGGQRQRVAMGRAMVRRPKVFLLDEPLSNLDAQFRGQMRAELARLQRRLGVTTVYVTHDQTEAMTLGDRVAILRAGEVQQVATPRELYSAPANLFVAGFIGTPPMNLLPARIGDDRLSFATAEISLTLDERAAIDLPNGPLIVGIRPESLVPVDDAEATSSLRGTVDLVEWLGSELFVHLDLGTAGLESPAALAAAGVTSSAGVQRLIARLDPDASFERGQTLGLGVSLASLHLFHPETGDQVRATV
ncbi:Glycerol-3-phosphate-transporting ATPase [Thiorhodococcus drewsii AZ1]|uniref:Glycerol-3-phosphate-transporting ATPase n=1 Tax=Thiorhodococcus drewsii AZ1 TaxID=765913 RepID=G2DYE5_9GAMM|nr:ABC transporter ATP-binding protein [Thiorhodococcus drewsii]EGV32572.1 Glycerol-3-phosphate-transporting ATPase [Thiorhodococcus drewsii AZ1]